MVRRQLLNLYRKNGERNFHNVDLTGASLNDANLQEAEFCGANFQDVNLSRVNLCNANLQGANLEHANLLEANLCDVNLCGANLRWANLKSANLSKANLCNADLRGANLENANLLDANLCDADLRYANLLNVKVRGHANLEKQLDIEKLRGATKPDGTKIPLRKPILRSAFKEKNQETKKNKGESSPRANINQASEKGSITNARIQEVAINNNCGKPEVIYETGSAEIEEFAVAKEDINATVIFTSNNLKEEEAKKRITVSINQRRGQLQFRKNLLTTYNSCCAITGCDAQEALEAAHIIPYSEEENNDSSNGLLLRADIHTLFDLNLIAIHPETLKVYLEPSLLNTDYKELDGKSLQLPENINKNAPQWRWEHCKWDR